MAFGLEVRGSVLASGLESAGTVNLDGAQVAGHLVLSGASLGGTGSSFTGIRLRVEHDLEAEGLSSASTVDLTGAQVDGQLLLRRATLVDRATAEADAPAALVAYRLHAASDVFCSDLKARGSILLSGAVVTRTLELDRVCVKGAQSGVVARTLHVGKDLTCRRLHAEGTVDLDGAVVEGNLGFEEARLHALSGRGLHVHQELALTPHKVQEKLDLTRVKAGSLTLAHRRETWPALGTADGWRLGGLGVESPADEREETPWSTRGTPRGGWPAPTRPNRSRRSLASSRPTAAPRLPSGCATGPRSTPADAPTGRSREDVSSTT